MNNTCNNNMSELYMENVRTGADIHDLVVDRLIAEGLLRRTASRIGQGLGKVGGYAQRAGAMFTGDKATADRRTAAGFDTQKYGGNMQFRKSLMLDLMKDVKKLKKVTPQDEPKFEAEINSVLDRYMPVTDQPGVADTTPVPSSVTSTQPTRPMTTKPSSIANKDKAFRDPKTGQVQTRTTPKPTVTGTPPPVSTATTADQGTPREPTVTGPGGTQVVPTVTTKPPTTPAASAATAPEEPDTYEPEGEYGYRNIVNSLKAKGIQQGSHSSVNQQVNDPDFDNKVNGAMTSLGYHNLDQAVLDDIKAQKIGDVQKLASYLHGKSSKIGGVYKEKFDSMVNSLLNQYYYGGPGGIRTRVR